MRSGKILLVALTVIGAILVMVLGFAFLSCQDDWGALRVAAAAPFPPAGAEAIRHMVLDITEAMDDAQGIVHVNAAVFEEEEEVEVGVVFEEKVQGSKGAEEKDIRYWWHYGTLLGAYREKDIIAHDYDADMIVIEEDFQALLQALRTHLDQDHYRVVSCKTGARVVCGCNAMTDIFVARVVTDKADGKKYLVSNAALAFPWETPFRIAMYETFPYDDIFPLKRSPVCAIQGQEIPVAGKPERALEFLYGPNYMTPEKKNVLNTLTERVGGAMASGVAAVVGGGRFTETGDTQE